MDYPCGFRQEEMATKPICGVLAVAMAANVAYPVAHATCRAALFKLYPRRQRFGGSTTIPSISLALEMLAVKFTIYEHENGRAHSMKSFASYVAKPGVVYLVRVSGHIMTFHDGIYIDQMGKRHYTKLRRNRRITHYYEILGKGW